MVGQDASRKLVGLLEEIGLDAFGDWVRMLDVATGAEFRRRLGALEPGSYSSTAWAEVADDLYKVPCALRVDESSLSFDLTRAPDQIPHFVNSKPYILRASLVPTLRGILASGLPLTQSMYDAIDILTRPAPSSIAVLRHPSEPPTWTAVWRSSPRCCTACRWRSRPRRKGVHRSPPPTTTRRKPTAGLRRARHAVSRSSGAALAIAPAHWTDGCAVLEEAYTGPGPISLVLRSYLDPVTGRALHTGLVPEGAPRSFSALPDRWASD